MILFQTWLSFALDKQDLWETINHLNNTFISNELVDLNFYRRGGEKIMPLHVKDMQEDQTTWVENLIPEFRNYIDSKYQEHFDPRVILGYIYAVLYHQNYREKYFDFLKIDFPKIPFVESKEKFLALSKLGNQLIDIHLMIDPPPPQRKKMINIALVVVRQISSQSYQHTFITNSITESSYISNKTREINYIYPLYLKKG